MAWYSSWTRAQQLAITVPSGTVAPLSYFPVVLTAASLPTELTNNTYGRSDGGDLAFATDLGAGNSLSSIGAQIPCEVVSAAFGGTPTAEIHVQVPSVAATGTTTYLWVLYGNSGQTAQPAASSTYGAQAVWNENGTQNYVGVWHLQGSGTPANWADSTKNGLTGTNFGATAAGGKFGSSTGSAASFNGSSAYINCGNQSLANFGSSNFTVSSWMNAAQVKAQVPIGQGKYAHNGWYTFLSSGSPYVYLATDTTTESTIHSVTQYNTGGWQSVTWVRTGTTTGNIYYDGAPLSILGAITSPGDCTEGLIFGSDFSHVSNLFYGLLDEIRISSLARPVSWITAEYANQSAPGTFTQPSGSPLPTISTTLAAALLLGF